MSSLGNRIQSITSAQVTRDGALLIGALLVVTGILVRGFGWEALAPRILDSLALGCLTGAAGLLGARWFGWPRAGAALLVAAAFALWFEGVSGVAAGLLVLAGGGALGTLLPGAGKVDALARWVAGTGLLAALLGWLVPWQVHQAPVWVMGLLALVVWRRAPLRTDVNAIGEWVGPLVHQAPWAAFATAVVAVVAGATAWLPIGNPDDLAYHVNIGHELLDHGQGRLDLGAQAWALAPWSSDLLHALAALLAGRESTGVLNFSWLLATILLMARLASGLGLVGRHAWMAAMLYASLPLTSFLAGSMQSEAATAAALCAMAVVVGFDPAPRTYRIGTIAALAGFMLGTKISNALFLLPVVVWLVMDWRRDVPWRALPLAGLIGFFAAGSTYLYGLLLTGNPFVPMFNGFFRSRWFPAENFEDPTWQTGIRWDAPWELVFRTPGYFEGQAGAAGVVLLLLLLGVVPALMAPRTRTLALVSVAAIVLVFMQVQYLRYFHPALALWIPAVLAALLASGASRPRWPDVVIGVAIGLQVALASTSGWMLAAGAIRTLFLEGRQAVSDRFVPERTLLSRWELIAEPTDRVLFTDPLRSFTSVVPGLSVGVAWFTPILASIRTAKAETDPSTWGALVDRAGANHVLAYDLASKPGLMAFLAARHARRIDANGAAEIYWLPPKDDAPSPAEGANLPISQLSTSDSAVLAGPSRPKAKGSSNQEIQIPVAREYPVLGQVAIDLTCGKPGEPIAVGWTLVAALGKPASHWEWLPCGPDGKAIAAIQFTSGAESMPLVLSVKPAKSESGMLIGVADAKVDLRRDFHAQTALADWLEAGACLGECEAESATLKPVTRVLLLN